MVKKIQDNLTNIVVILGLIASIGAGFTKFAKMESTIEQLSNQTAPDLSGINGFAILDINKEIALIQKELETHGHNNDHSHDNSAIKILQKEIEVLKLEIEELKEASKNPLS
jgi:hypothetical protein